MLKIDLSQISFRTTSQTLISVKKEEYEAYTAAYKMLSEQGSIDLKMSALTLAEILVLIVHMSDFNTKDQEIIKESILSFINVRHRTNTPVYPSYDALLSALKAIDD